MKEWGIVQRTQKPAERALSGPSWNNMKNKINKVVFSCNANYTVNI